ncbi:hypothetical protein NMY22_g20267 [Coprinellus aureogranulatus]|nr:hypothetical protein NMY22_g20267 [Coprinellus aureogranulatus]
MCEQPRPYPMAMFLCLRPYFDFSAQGTGRRHHLFGDGTGRNALRQAQHRPSPAFSPYPCRIVAGVTVAPQALATTTTYCEIFHGCSPREGIRSVLVPSLPCTAYSPVRAPALPSPRSPSRISGQLPLPFPSVVPASHSILQVDIGHRLRLRRPRSVCNHPTNIEKDDTYAIQNPQNAIHKPKPASNRVCTPYHRLLVSRTPNALPLSIPPLRRSLATKLEQLETILFHPSLRLSPGNEALGAIDYRTPYDDRTTRTVAADTQTPYKRVTKL